MTVGPLVAAGGLVLMTRVGHHAQYTIDVLPGVVLFGLGLSALVAPLTGAVLGAVPAAEAGVASGVNNAVARTASLLAVAALPSLAGLSRHSFADPDEFDSGFRVAMWICVCLLIAGGVLAGALIGRRAPGPHVDSVDCLPHCAVTGPAVQPGRVWCDAT